MDQPRLLVGAMSGTSADGVDVALVRVEGRGLEMTPTLLRHHHSAYDSAAASLIFEIRRGGACKLDALASLGRSISERYASAVNELLKMTHTPAAAVAAIAAHGQTLFHHPPDTIQWLDPALLAERTHCAVVSDFRRADCAAGGQGAPLVPFADFILFRDSTECRAIVNIGGIANITFLPPGCGIEEVRAFDTGPGNCISDHLVRRYFPGGPGIDVDGALAGRGNAIEPLLKRIQAHHFFHQTGPRSTDGPAMIKIFENASASSGAARPEDELATACALTSWGIAHAIRLLRDRPPDQTVVSGGGVRNAAIMRFLRQQLPNVRSSEEFGVPSAAKEALAFALLGAATLDGVASNVPAATGARRSVVLGSITPAPIP